jgi:homopolymeric O-antigen transport system permease protein
MSQGEAAIPVRHASGTPSALTLLREGIDDVLSRRRLIRYLTQADMKKRGSDTLLGNLWWVLDPLLQMLVYIALVAIIGRGLAHPDYPLFIFSAILPWKWFQSVVTDATSTVVRQERLIRQIAFPKLILPMATTISGVVGFIFGLIPLAVLLLWFGRATPQLVWLPVIAGVQFVFTLAMAVLVSAANVFFRDLGNAVGHLLRLWWFLSPGLYSLSNVHGLLGEEHSTLATLASLNPFAVLFESYRAVIYGPPDGLSPPVGPPDFAALGWLLLASLVLAALAIVFFKRVEPDFAKLI